MVYIRIAGWCTVRTTSNFEIYSVHNWILPFRKSWEALVKPAVVVPGSNTPHRVRWPTVCVWRTLNSSWQGVQSDATVSGKPYLDSGVTKKRRRITIFKGERTYKRLGIKYSLKVPEYLCTHLTSIFRVYTHKCWNSKGVKNTFSWYEWNNIYKLYENKNER